MPSAKQYNTYLSAREVKLFTYNKNNTGPYIDSCGSAAMIHGWHGIIQVCFDERKITTLYTQHMLYGTVYAGSVKSNIRPSYTAIGMQELYRNWNPNNLYIMARLMIYLLTGKDYAHGENGFFLSKGHYSPEADFHFRSWRDLSNFFVNLGFQWMCINGGNWEAIERIIRELAKKLQVDFFIATGPFGVLKLMKYNRNQQETGEMVAITLEMPTQMQIKNYIKKEDKLNIKNVQTVVDFPQIPVPAYYWKIVYNPKNNQCIVLIMTNNPYLEKPPNPFFCENICEKYNWPKLFDRVKGYLFCCDYKDFVKKVKYAPNYPCLGVLTIPY